MVLIRINKQDFELFSYNNPKEEAPLSVSFNPGSLSLNDIIELIASNKDDIIIKNDDTESAHFVNYTQLVSISQEFSDVNKINAVIKHPLDSERLDRIESSLGNANLRLDTVDDSILNLNLVTNDNVIGIATLNQNVEIARTDIYNNTKSIETTNNVVGGVKSDVDVAKSNISTHSESITGLQEMLEITQEAIDDIIMKSEL